MLKHLQWSCSPSSGPLGRKEYWLKLMRPQKWVREIEFTTLLRAFHEGRVAAAAGPGHPSFLPRAGGGDTKTRTPGRAGITLKHNGSANGAGGTALSIQKFPKPKLRTLEVPARSRLSCSSKEQMQGVVRSYF